MGLVSGCAAAFDLFREYRHNMREIGTIMPDSKACINALLAGVPFATAKVIVEFGGASGAVTREIVWRKRAETRVISFEKNANLYRALRTEFQDSHESIVNEDVFHCRQVLRRMFGIGDGSVDCIVSTLPCSSMDFDGLLRASVMPALKRDGIFIQYMHVLSVLKGFFLKDHLQKYFMRLESAFVLRNIPPAIVYRCRQPVRVI